MKQIIFILMMAVLPLGAMAQVDDLYFVPKKKQAKKEVKTTTSSNAVKVAPATVSTPQNGTNVVRIGQKSNIVNGIDEDEYNRRSTPTYSTEQEYTEEESYEYSDEQTYDETAIDGDYTYSSRIVRFHSPRRAVLLSSPLYWDVVYNSGLDNWTIYDDGIYWDVYPDYSYTTFYSSPWYYPSWRWSYGCGWGLSLGWYSPWHWDWGYHHHHHWHYPHYYFGGHHHGHHIAGGSWHRPFNGGYRNAIYSDRNGRGGSYVPRASGPSRANAGVRAGSVARSNKNAAVQSGRTVRKSDSNVQRVYNRPSSTRNNATRNGITNERTNSTRNNNATRVENGTRTNNNRVNNATRTNNTVRENSNGTKVQRPTRNTTQKRESVNSNSNQKSNRSSVNNRTSSESRSSVTRSNNSSRSSNSRSSIGSQSRSSGFSGGGSRGGSGGGSRGGGSRGGGGGRR